MGCNRVKGLSSRNLVFCSASVVASIRTEVKGVSRWNMLGTNVHLLYWETQASRSGVRLIHTTHRFWAASPLVSVSAQEEGLRMSALRGHALHLLTYALIFLFLPTRKEHSCFFPSFLCSTFHLFYFFMSYRLQTCSYF